MMGRLPEGNAIVYCDGAFDTTYGKTAHGLVRFTRRYRVAAVIDGAHAGRDAGEVLDGHRAGIPVVASLDGAIAEARASDRPATHLVIGIAPDGGAMSAPMRAAVRAAVERGLSVDSGLHDFLTDDESLVALAAAKGVTLRDVRKTPPRRELHPFTGKIEAVTSFRVAVLGSDSCVGKRTTAWLLVRALEDAGLTAEMIGTGQTAWMQGVEYGIIMDSLANDFVAGEIEHAVFRAWSDRRPDVIVVEGQGSLMNPAYPGGFEILAAARPDAVVLQHAPARREYDGFPGFPLHPIETQIRAIELLSGRPVVAVTVNHENLAPAEVAASCAELAAKTGLPVCDPLIDGAGPVVAALRKRMGR